jgi:predicted DNA-binding protein
MEMSKVSSFLLPEDLRARVKVVTALEGISMKQFIYDAIEDRLEKFEKKGKEGPFYSSVSKKK